MARKIADITAQKLPNLLPVVLSAHRGALLLLELRHMLAIQISVSDTCTQLLTYIEGVLTRFISCCRDISIAFKCCASFEDHLLEVCRGAHNSLEFPQPTHNGGISQLIAALPDISKNTRIIDNFASKGATQSDRTATLKTSV